VTLADTASSHPSLVDIDPAILYFGTPVALISTVSGSGHPNVTPMSSVFWLGRTALLGLAARSQAAMNLTETGECVIVLPSSDQVEAVDRLALTTGRNPVSERKAAVGYAFERDKFGRAGLTPVPSHGVRPFSAAECPVNLEGRVVALHPLEADDPQAAGSITAFEVKVGAVRIHEDLRMAGHPNRIDPDRWRPLIMSFQKFYGLTEQVHPSRLSTISEEWYRRRRSGR